MRQHVRLMLLLLAFGGGAGQFGPGGSGPGDGGAGDEDTPEPTDEECREIFRSGRCNQTALQQLASAGSPLFTPLPFISALQLLASEDMGALVAWSSSKDMGNYALCTDDEDSHHCTVRAFGGPSLGTCLPKSCSSTEYLQRFSCEARLLDVGLNVSRDIIPALGNYTQGIEAFAQALDYLALKSRSFCADDDGDLALTGSAKVMLVVLGLLLGAVVVATLASALGWGHTGAEAWAAYCAHFDALANVRRLFAVRPASPMDALNGIRCLSTGYVILGHTFLLVAFTSSNLVPSVLNYGSSFESMAIVFAFFAVDAFFWLSGFLVAYSLLPVAQRAAAPSPGAPFGGARALGQSALAVVHRYARLTPVYALVLFSYATLLPYVGSGPMWSGIAQSSGGDYCLSHWWTNLLYVNNVVGGERKGTAGCMGWSWYLANDFQFFFASALVLPWYPSAPRAVAAVFVAAVVMSVVVTWVLSHTYGADITTLDGPNNDHIYNNPLSRCGAYAVGVLFGIFWHRRAVQAGVTATDSRSARGLSAWALSAWVVSGMVLGALYAAPWSNFSDGGLLNPAARRWSQGAKDAWNALQRPCFAAAFSGVVHCLLTGHGGIVREFLSAKVWEVLGKLSYGA